MAANIVAAERDARKHRGQYLGHPPRRPQTRGLGDRARSLQATDQQHAPPAISARPLSDGGRRPTPSFCDQSADRGDRESQSELAQIVAIARSLSPENKVLRRGQKTSTAASIAPA
jgi:hypothetical protein